MSAVAEPLVIGVDGGGTKTLLAAADRAGGISTLLRGAGTNPFDAPGWRDVLDGFKPGVTPIAPAVLHAAFGLPGYGEVSDVSAAQEAAAAGFGLSSWSVLNDVEAAFEAAFVGRPGVLLLAGTGSMLWGRSAEGRDIRVGGWGQGFGDEGSAYWMGRELLGRVSRALDRRLAGEDRSSAVALGDALFRHLGLDGRDPQNALMGWYASQAHPRSAIAALAGFIDGEASAGNATATNIMEIAANHLALHVRAAWRAMAGPDETTAPAAAVPWSYAGGAFRSRLLLDRVTALLETAPLEPALPPLGGALLRAAQKAGWDTGERWLAGLKTSLACCLDQPSGSR